MGKVITYQYGPKSRKMWLALADNGYFFTDNRSRALVFTNEVIARELLTKPFFPRVRKHDKVRIESA